MSPGLVMMSDGIGKAKKKTKKTKKDKRKKTKKKPLFFVALLEIKKQNCENQNKHSDHANNKN